MQNFSFVTGAIPAGGSAMFLIPDAVPSGTVIPYYCTIDMAQMGNAGQITVQ